MYSETMKRGIINRDKSTTEDKATGKNFNTGQKGSYNIIFTVRETMKLPLPACGDSSPLLSISVPCATKLKSLEIFISERHIQKEIL